jgi:ABC-type antimicrobial peptide transport system permease subunit
VLFFFFSGGCGGLFSRGVATAAKKKMGEKTSRMWVFSMSGVGTSFLCVLLLTVCVCVSVAQVFS